MREKRGKKGQIGQQINNYRLIPTLQMTRAAKWSGCTTCHVTFYMSNLLLIGWISYLAVAFRCTKELTLLICCVTVAVPGIVMTQQYLSLLQK